MDGDCSHEIKRHLILVRKVITTLDSILKRRDVTLPTKVSIVKTIVFPVVTYGCESWTTKKAEHWRIDAFELWCWRRLLRVPWAVKRSNQSILKEINPEYSLEGMMLKLKLPYFGHWWEELTHWKRPWCWESEGRRRRGRQRMRWLDGIMDSVDMSMSKLGRWWRAEKLSMLWSMRSPRIKRNLATEQQQYLLKHLFIYAFICLAASGLHRSMRRLCCILLGFIVCRGSVVVVWA